MTMSTDFGGPDSHAHVSNDVARRRSPAAVAPLILALVVAGLALTVKTWGLVALGLTALAMVPVIFATLILITIGK